MSVTGDKTLNGVSKPSDLPQSGSDQGSWTWLAIFFNASMPSQPRDSLDANWFDRREEWIRGRAGIARHINRETSRVKFPTNHALARRGRTAVDSSYSPAARTEMENCIKAGSQTKNSMEKDFDERHSMSFWMSYLTACVRHQNFVWATSGLYLVFMFRVVVFSLRWTSSSCRCLVEGAVWVMTTDIGNVVLHLNAAFKFYFTYSLPCTRRLVTLQWMYISILLNGLYCVSGRALRRDGGSIEKVHMTMIDIPINPMFGSAQMCHPGRELKILVSRKQLCPRVEHWMAFETWSLAWGLEAVQWQSSESLDIIDEICGTSTGCTRCTRSKSREFIYCFI